MWPYVLWTKRGGSSNDFGFRFSINYSKGWGEKRYSTHRQAWSMLNVYSYSGCVEHVWWLVSRRYVHCIYKRWLVYAWTLRNICFYIWCTLASAVAHIYICTCLYMCDGKYKLRIVMWANVASSVYYEYISGWPYGVVFEIIMAPCSCSSMYVFVCVQWNLAGDAHAFNSFTNMAILVHAVVVVLLLDRK